jgi:capsular polysaccharide biosynthesis protein
MEPKDNDVIEIDLKVIFFVLLHKLWLIILIGIIGATSAWALSSYILKPVYTSTAKVYVINKQDENAFSYSDLQSGTQLTQDYKVLVKSRVVTEQVIKKLNLNMSSEFLSASIQVNTPKDTRILEINVIDEDPILAKQLADTVAEISAERIVSLMDVKKVNIIDEGNLPKTPSSPNIRKNTILGGIGGATLVSVIIVLIHLLNDRIRTIDDIEKYLGITALGMLPLEEAIQEKKHKKERRIKHSRNNNKTALARREYGTN